MLYLIFGFLNFFFDMKYKPSHILMHSIEGSEVCISGDSNSLDVVRKSC